MKRWNCRNLVFLVLCVSLLLPCFSVLGEAEDTGDGPELLAEAAVVMDMADENLLYSKAIMEAQYPGGLVKIMTVLLLAENCDLTEQVSFSEILYDIEEGSNCLGLQPGEEITLYDAACAILLGSANDVCNGVAEYISGSTEAFAELMNARAEELGCVNTHFSNPHGLSSDDQYTCAYDLALIARTAWENDAFREICGLTAYTIPATNLTESERALQNYHQMLQYGSAYYREWCVGGKESYTSQSLNTIVTFGSSNGMELVSVVMGVYDAGEAYEETIALLEYGFGDSAEAETVSEESGNSAGESTGEGSGSTGLLTDAEGTGDGLSTGEDQTQSGGEDSAAGWLTGYFNKGKSLVLEYTKHNFTVVFVVWCVLMFVLLIFIVLLLLRCFRNPQISQKRRKEETVWQENEAEMAKQTLEELEAEIRRRKNAENSSEDKDS